MTFQFPDYSAQGVTAGGANELANVFPYANLLAQLRNAFIALPTASYGRWNGTGVSQDLGSPSGINPGPAQGYPQPQPPQPPQPPMQPQGGGLLGGAIPKAAVASAPAGDPSQGLPQGARVVPTSSTGLLMTPAEQMARANIAASTDPTALYAALGQSMASRGLSQDQIAQALNSFGGTGGANGGAQINQLRNQFGYNYGNAFQGTPFAQYFQNMRNPYGGVTSGALPSLPGVV